MVRSGRRRARGLAYNRPVEIRFEASVPLPEGAAPAAALLSARRYRVAAGTGGVLSADRGSRFALVPEGLLRRVRVVPEGKLARLSGSVSAFGWPREALAAEARAFQEEIAALLAGAPSPARRSPPPRAVLLWGLCVLVAGAAFWLLGRNLVASDLAAIRAGRLAWEFFPVAEPLNAVPAAVPWMAAGFLAGTAGVAAGTALAGLLLLGTRFPAASEVLGGLLGWASLLAPLALTAGLVEGGRVGLARSMLDPMGLAAAALAPWAAWGLARRLPPGRDRPGPDFLAALAVLLLGAMALAWAMPAPPLPEDPVARAIAREYPYHAFRDRWLLENPVGETLAASYYRYTPYAGLLTSATVHPERVSLRLLTETGTFLWLAAPLAGLFLGVSWGAARVAGRRAAPWLGAALSAAIAWAFLLPSVFPRPEGWRERLSAPSGRVRGEAYHAAAMLARPEETPALRDGLADADVRARLWSVTALGRLGDRPSFTRILDLAADDPHYLVRSRAADALRLFAEGGSPDAFDADAVLARVVRARAREPFPYIRLRLLWAQDAWEKARNR